MSGRDGNLTSLKMLLRTLFSSTAAISKLEIEPKSSSLNLDCVLTISKIVRCIVVKVEEAFLCDKVEFCCLQDAAVSKLFLQTFFRSREDTFLGSSLPDLECMMCFINDGEFESAAGKRLSQETFEILLK